MEMKSAIKRRQPKDTATANEQTVPATSVRCKHCSRRFAKISAEGGLNPFILHEQACASCEPFLGLYDDLKTKQQEHMALLDRGPKHHGRILAHEEFRKARVALENFLVSIEAPNDASFDVAQAGFANRAEPESLQRVQEPEDAPKVGGDQGILDDASPPGDLIPAPAASLATKRKTAHTSGVSFMERKRIKFREDVEERPEYRGTLEYYRGAKEYIPGRYAVTEGSEYEDTSGSTISFAKFTGQKKLGSTFVDIVSKEEAQDGEEGSSAIKKRGKDSGKKDLGLADISDASEKDESQMNSRELRLSRRTTSTISPAPAKPRRVSAQYDGQGGTSPDAANGVPSLDVVLKSPDPYKDHAAINGDMPTPASQHEEERQQTSDKIGRNETAIETTVSRGIKEAVSKVRRELRELQQTVIPLEYMDSVSKAVRGCFAALKPLEHLDRIRPLEIEDASETQDEDDSIYFEASDGTGEATSATAPDLDQQEPPTAVKVIPKWSEVTADTRGSGEPEASITLNISALDDMPMKDKQDLFGALDLEQIENKKSANVSLPAHSIGSSEERADQTQAEPPTTVRSRSGNRNSHSPVATQPHTSHSANSASRRRSGRISSTAPPVDRSPEDELNKAPARPSTTKSRKPRVALSSRPASSLPAAPDPKEWKQLEAITDSGNERMADQSSTLELDGNKIAGEDPPGEAESVQAGYPGTRTAGIDTGQCSNHTAYQGPVTLLEATLDASLVQPPESEAQREVAESMNRGFGELINSRDDKQDTDTKSESETHSKAPHLVNNPNFGVAVIGEAGQESEVDITDTHRHGAGEEAQVDPQTAPGLAEVTTTETRSADRSFQNTIDTSNAELQDAV
jgi:hypothetical protein